MVVGVAAPPEQTCLTNEVPVDGVLERLSKVLVVIRLCVCVEVHDAHAGRRRFLYHHIGVVGELVQGPEAGGKEEVDSSGFDSLDPGRHLGHIVHDHIVNEGIALSPVIVVTLQNSALCRVVFAERERP